MPTGSHADGCALQAWAVTLPFPQTSMYTSPGAADGVSRLCDLGLTWVGASAGRKAPELGGSGAQGADLFGAAPRVARPFQTGARLVAGDGRQYM